LIFNNSVKSAFSQNQIKNPKERCIMKKIISRGLLYSDVHLSIDSTIEQERWYPPICTALQKIEGSLFLPNNLVGRFLAAFDRVTRESLENLLRTSYKQGPYDYAVGFGDYVAGDNESGMVNGSANDYAFFKSRFDSFFGNLLSLRVWGDHCAGYRFDVSKRVGVKIGTEKGGISFKSVGVARSLIGEPFGIRIFPGATFVYMSTNLLRNVNAESEEELQELKKQQLDFLKTTLNLSGSIFLCMHDPTALPLDKELVKLLYDCQKNIRGIIHGHMHSKYARGIVLLTYPFYEKLCRDFSVELVPSPSGMFGAGSGFKVLNTYNDGTYAIEKHNL
jgi:hypothetical protein